jgi:hypothetical protein
MNQISPDSGIPPESASEGFGISRELIPPIEGVHLDARATRSDTKSKLLAGIARREVGSTT